jgi:MFS transporter, FHS family, Na+ dependent glucose transporter 1
MVGMLLLMATMLGVVPPAPTLWLVAAAWFGLGLAGGGIDVGGNTLLSWLHGRGLPPYMSALHFFFGVGSFLAPLIVGGALVLNGEVDWAYWILALLVVPAALWLVRLPSPTPGSSLTPSLSGELSPTAGARRRFGGGQAAGERDRQQRIVILICLLLLLLYVGAEVAFGGWIYGYAVTTGLASESAAAYLTSAFWGALTAGRLAGIPLAVRFRPRSILAADLVGCLASVAVLIFWPSSKTALWLGASGLGLAMASIFPAALSLAERRIPITGRVTGWFLVASSIGGMVVPWLIGQLFEPVGPRSAMVLIFLTLLATAAVLVVLLKEGD